ncbi:MAG: hypothetical protein M0R30_00215 [Methanoregula sp.]|jgi:hypothetical protein|uniref:hypothetical protein n=1 Tax=Methanoregula sp. TaxID=2052170 RepID=UPI0025CFEDD7|nr:hypothetical protein [Methanoregula sp.]MCK9630043.1 hypothetical protein [Methanoregula sp.]
MTDVVHVVDFYQSRAAQNFLIRPCQKKNEQGVKGCLKNLRHGLHEKIPVDFLKKTA